MQHQYQRIFLTLIEARWNAYIIMTILAVYLTARLAGGRLGRDS